MDAFKRKAATVPWWVLLLLISAAIAFSRLLQIVGTPLTTDAAPRGIISFEFAGTPERAEAILASWDERAQLHAALSLGLDYLFLLVYSTAIALSCFRAAAWWKPRRPGLATIGAWLGWGQWLAALLDAVENYALIQLLLGHRAAIWPRLAWACAAVKFAFVLAGIAYALLSGLYYLGRGRSQG